MRQVRPVGFEEERNLPRFEQTAIAKRMSLLIPVVMAVIAAYQGQLIFDGIRHWHPSSYSQLSHIAFMASLPVPVIALLVGRTNPETKQAFGIYLTFGYIAIVMLAQQVTSYILP